MAPALEVGPASLLRAARDQTVGTAAAKAIVGIFATPAGPMRIAMGKPASRLECQVFRCRQRSIQRPGSRSGKSKGTGCMRSIHLARLHLNNEQHRSANGLVPALRDRTENRNISSTRRAAKRNIAQTRADMERRQVPVQRIPYHTTYFRFQMVPGGGTNPLFFCVFLCPSLCVSP